MSAQDVKAPEREPDAWLWLGGDGKPLTCALERIPYNDQTYYRVALYRDPQPDAEREAGTDAAYGLAGHLSELWIKRLQERLQAEVAAARDREKGLRDAGDRIVRNVEDDWRGGVVKSELTQDAIRAWRDLLASETHDEGNSPELGVQGAELAWARVHAQRKSVGSGHSDDEGKP